MKTQITTDNFRSLIGDCGITMEDQVRTWLDDGKYVYLDFDQISGKREIIVKETPWVENPVAVTKPSNDRIGNWACFVTLVLIGILMYFPISAAIGVTIHGSPYNVMQVTTTHSRFIVMNSRIHHHWFGRGITITEADGGKVVLDGNYRIDTLIDHSKIK